MPISVALPAPSIEWLAYFYFPSMDTVGGIPFSPMFVWGNSAIRPSQSRPAIQQVGAGSPNTWQPYGSVSTSGNTARLEQRLGRPCFRLSNSVAGDTVKNGAGILPVDWSAVYDDAAASLNPGARQVPQALCAVFDFHVSLGLVGAAASAGNDRVGFFFLPDQPGAQTGSTPGGGLPPVRGFGLMLNTVAGVATWEYVSWADGGAILERVTVGASIVPSIVNWSTIRFILVSAGSSGRAPSVSVQVNGFDVVTGRVFGSAELADPTSSGTAGGPVAYMAWGGGSDVAYFAMSAKLGRFTPTGTELEPE